MAGIHFLVYHPSKHLNVPWGRAEGILPCLQLLIFSTRPATQLILSIAERLEYFLYVDPLATFN